MNHYMWTGNNEQSNSNKSKSSSTQLQIGVDFWNNLVTDAMNNK